MKHSLFTASPWALSALLCTGLLGPGTLRAQSGPALGAADGSETSVADGPWSRNDHLSHGLQAYSRGDWANAASMLQQALQTELVPDEQLVAAFYLSESLYFTGQAAQAAGGYDSILQSQSSNPLVQAAAYRRGEVAVHLQRSIQGEQWLQLYLSQYPEGDWAPYAELLLGHLHLQRGETAQARQYFARSLAHSVIDRQRVRALLGIAQAEFFGNQVERAAATLQQIPTNADMDDELRWELSFWQGITDLARGDYSRAAGGLKEAAVRVPQHPLAAAAYWHAGEAYRGAQQWSYADACYQEVLDRWPESPYSGDALIGQMRTSLATRRYDQIEQLARSFIERFPSGEQEGTASRLVGKSLNAQGRFDEALRYFSALVEQDPRAETDLGQRAAYGHAVALAGLQRYEEAAAELNQLETLVGLNDSSRRTVRQARQILAELAANGPTAPNPFPNNPFPTDPLPNNPFPAPPGPGSGPPNSPGFPRPSTGTTAALITAIQRQVQAGELQRALEQIQANLAALSRAAELPELVRQIAEKGVAAREEATVDAIFRQWATRGTGELPTYGRWGLASSAIARQQATAALTELDQIINRSPSEPLSSEVLLARGQVYEQQQNWAAARQDYERLMQALGTDPRAAHAVLNAARMAERQGDSRTALTYLDRLKTQFPSHSRADAAAYLEAWIYSDAGDSARAATLFRWIHDNFPQSRYWNDATYRLAETTYQLPDYPTTDQLLQQLLQGAEDPEVWPHAFFLSGQVHVAEGSWSAARDRFQQLLTRYPQSPLREVTSYWIAETYYQQRNFNVAQQYLEPLTVAAASGTEPWKAMVLLRQAQLFDALGQWAKVSPLITQLRTRFPNLNRNDELDYLTARLLAAENRFDEARRQLQTIIARGRTQAGSRETAAMSQWMMGETYWNEKKYEQAIQAYLTVNQDYEEYSYWVAASLFKAAYGFELLGNTTKAKELYDLVTTDPDFQQTEFARQAVTRLLALPAPRTGANR